MAKKKNPAKRQALQQLYEKLCETAPPDEAARMNGWLRLHLLMQAFQVVRKKICTARELEALWSERPASLQKRAPLLETLLDSFPLHDLFPLSRDVLHGTHLLYKSTEVPHLGTLYTLVQSPEEIKYKGQVLTPPLVVKHAYSLLKEKPHGRIFDLSCGAGDYLLIAYRHLRKQYKKRGLSPIESHERILHEHLFGIDNDPVILAIAKFRLFLLCPSSALLAPHLHLLNAYQLFTHDLSKCRYDLIVGNPPWGGCITAHEKSWIKKHFPVASACSKCNSFVVFLEASIRLLKDRGMFSLLLPAAFLNVLAYQDARRWLLDNAELQALQLEPRLFPDRFAPALFLAGRRASPPDNRHLVTVCQPSTPHVPAVRKRFPQAVFRQAPFFIYNIHYQPQLESLFARLHQNAFYLQQGVNVSFLLGIVTGRNTRHLKAASAEENCEPIYTADDLHRFHLAKPRCFIRFDRARFQQAAPSSRYRTKEKLLYKFISKELITAIDRSGAYTLNNVNCILPLRLPCSLPYLAGLLNSVLLNTYYLYRFFTGKVLTAHLSALPLRLPASPEASEIEQLAVRMETCPDSSFLHALNEAVYRIYHVTPEEKHLVEQMHRQLKALPFV